MSSFSLLLTFLSSLLFFFSQNIQTTTACGFTKPSKCFKIVEDAAKGIKDAANGAKNVGKDIQSFGDTAISRFNTANKEISKASSQVTTAFSKVGELGTLTSQLANKVANGLKNTWDDIEDLGEDIGDTATDIFNDIEEFIEQLNIDEIFGSADLDADEEDFADSMKECVENIFDLSKDQQNFDDTISRLNALKSATGLDVIGYFSDLLTKQVSKYNFFNTFLYACANIDDWLEFTFDYMTSRNWTDALSGELFNSNRRRLMMQEMQEEIELTGAQRKLLSSFLSDENCDGDFCYARIREKSSGSWAVSSWLGDSILPDKTGYTDGEVVARYMLVKLAFDIISMIWEGLGEPILGSCMDLPVLKEYSCTIQVVFRIGAWAFQLISRTMESFVDFAGKHDGGILGNQLTLGLVNAEIIIENQYAMNDLINEDISGEDDSSGLRGVDATIGNFESKIGTLETTMTDMEGRVDTLTTDVNTLLTDTSNLATKMDELLNLIQTARA